MTFHVERIDHVVLRCRDLPGMVRFYEQALGFNVERKLEPHQPGADARRCLAARPDRTPSGPRMRRNMDHLCFRIEAVRP